MRYLLIVVCVLATACANNDLTSPTSPSNAAIGSAQTQARGGAALPFHGTVQGLEVDQVVPPNLLVNGTGDGVGTHLGRFTTTFDAVVALATGTATGHFTFVAANGDQIRATFDGQGTPTAQPLVVSIVEVATITSGTGRFSGVSGNFTIRRVLNQATGVSTGSFDGVINLGH